MTTPPLGVRRQPQSPAHRLSNAASCAGCGQPVPFHSYALRPLDPQTYCSRDCVRSAREVFARIHRPDNAPFTR